jgi:hypothetical protein
VTNEADRVALQVVTMAPNTNGRQSQTLLYENEDVERVSSFEKKGMRKTSCFKILEISSKF